MPLTSSNLVARASLKQLLRRYLDLPFIQSQRHSHVANTSQLVVVGAQSVGKSSLLQSLTDVPFPVGEDTCTRFATRIVSERTPRGTANKVKITITPPDFDTEHFNYVQDDAYENFLWERPSIEVEEFQRVVDEVS